MISQCPGCAAPRLNDAAFCHVCGLDFKTVAPAMPLQSEIAPQQSPAVPARAAAAPQATAPNQYPAPAPQPAPVACPRCGAPVYPGWTQCANCGLDLAAAWGMRAPASRRRIWPIALAIGIVVALVAVAGIFLVVKGSASGPQKITITMPTSGLTLIDNAAPSDTYAFYTSTVSEPSSASDLGTYTVVLCTGDPVANRAMQIYMGLGIYDMSVSQPGPSTAACIKDALATPKTIVVTQKTTPLPTDIQLVELVFD
jgi:hypothetical protein